MNIWIRTTTDSGASDWMPKPPPFQLEMLRQDSLKKPFEFVLDKEATGACQLKLKLNGLLLAVNELTDEQARSLAIACLKRNKEWTRLNPDSTLEEIESVVKSLAASPGMKSQDTMFPRWYRGNYSQDSTSLAKAAEHLQNLRLSAGSGLKVIVTEYANLEDESEADIILSATGTVRPLPGTPPAPQLPGQAIRLGLIILAAALCTWGIVHLISNTTERQSDRQTAPGSDDKH